VLIEIGIAIEIAIELCGEKLKIDPDPDPDPDPDFDLERSRSLHRRKLTHRQSCRSL
jgi:hypothetical protein